MDLAALLALLADLAALDDAGLEQLDADLVAAADERLDGEQTDEVLAELTQIADALDTVRAEGATRLEAAETRAAQAAALADRIHASEGGDEGGDDGEPAEGDEGAGDAGTEGGDDAGAGDEGEGGDAPAEGAEPEAVAAGAAPARRAPRLSRVNARRPDALPLRPPAFGAHLPADVAEWGLVASANAPGTQAGTPIRTREQLADAFIQAYELSQGYTQGPRTKVPVVRSGGNAMALYGNERFLGRDPIENERRIRAVTDPQYQLQYDPQNEVTAAGGRCAPSPVRYDLPVVGSDARPVRNDMLVRFGADRGGTITIPPPVIEDVEGAVDVWTEANDRNPVSPSTKPCLTITCPDEDETVVEAITRCLRSGTFRQKFFPEQIDAWMRLAAVNHARLAETQLLTTIGTESTQVSVGEGLGTTRDVLAGLDRATASLASRHRDLGITWRWGAPFWLLNQIRTDLAREMPGSTDERLAMADAQILAFFRVRGITPSFFLDGEAGQIFQAQGDGPLNPWPDEVVTYLYPEGSWLFLDGGAFELGLFRDAAMVLTNDFLIFGETFEEAHFHGVESWRLTFDVCPDGSTSGAVDFAPCAFGS